MLRWQARPVCQVENLLLSVRSHSGQCTLIVVSLCQDLPAPQTCLEMGVKAHPGMSSEKWLLISPVGLGYAIGLQCPQSKKAENP